MRKTLLRLLLILFVFQVTVATSSPIFSQSDTRLGELQKDIADLQGKIKDAQGTIKTLSSQIAVMNNQIRLTELRINQSKQELLGLEIDIELTEKKIVTLEASLDELSLVLIRRIVATYKIGAVKPWELLLSSNGFSDLLRKMQYVRIVQIQGKKLIYDTEQAKMDYTNQKDILEEKQKKVETVKKQLEGYTVELAQQRKDKESLLEITRGDEQTYQQQLARARAEQAAILGIIAGKGEETLVGKVSTGESVGTTIAGKSACSSGSHLHFEVVKDGAPQDPVSYLKNIALIFDYDQSQGRHFTPSGSWEWPMDSPIKINQDYGMTYWARVGWYNGGPHTGLDMFRDGQPLISTTNVKAVREGILYRGAIACGGGTLLYARVDHPDKIQSYYLHIVPK